jgi:type I restriction enzyme S subunit
MSKRTGTVDSKRVKPYPAYKDSGVEWLGDIPVNWQVKRLKLVAPARISKLSAKPDDAVYVGLEHVESWSGRLQLENQPESVDSVVASFRAGDVLFGKLRPYLAKAARPNFDGVCTSEILPLRPTAECSQSYVMYCLLNAPYIRWLDSLTYGTKMPRVGPEQVGNGYMPVPSESEQRAIAAFLDRETERIDALVAKKERLVELLQEKRTALITRAVTKGLNPTVPMKDSGVAWLGDIPAHWELKRLKHLLAATKGAIKTGPFGSQLQSSEMQSGDIKVYNQRSVLDRDFSSGENYVSLEKFAELHAFETFPGDLLITTRGSIGRCAVLPEDAERGILHPCVMRVQPDQRRISTRFLEIQIEEAAIVLDQLRFMSNATTIDVIYSESLREVWLTLPPLEEQAAIASFLDRETARIDTLVAKVHDAIERLKELRTALISAAVTGKIDVRQVAGSQNGNNSIDNQMGTS